MSSHSITFNYWPSYVIVTDFAMRLTMGFLYLLTHTPIHSPMHTCRFTHAHTHTHIHTHTHKHTVTLIHTHRVTHMHMYTSGVASRKVMKGQPAAAPWHLIIVIKITQKANDPMWASQHTVLHYSFTVYNIATLTT